MFTAKTSHNSSEKIWSGLKKRKNALPDYSVGEALFKQMRMYPTNICQISDTDGVSITYEEMLTISIRIAQNLNIEEGGIMGIMAVSSTYQAPVLFAAWLRGTIFHPINPFFDQNTVRHLFGITRPKVIFCDADNYDTLVGACKALEMKPLIYTINGRVEGVGNVLDLMEPTGSEDLFYPKVFRRDADDTAVIACSSGTTGLPKGVCISHTYLLNLSKPMPSGFVNFTFSNVDWISGLSFLLISALSSATRICTTENYSPQKLHQLIEKYKINSLAAAGSSIISSFVKSGEAQRCDCSSLRILAVGGASVSHSIYAEMQDQVKTGIVANFYFGTEFGGVSGNYSIGKPNSVGQLSDGVKARIMDDDGKNLGIGDIGEILVWNGRNWSGYYGNPTETQNMIDKQGWYHTGDLGFFDEDGDLHIVDRKKEIMKYRGFHYSAQEIENCILALNDVAEVCVFGTRDDADGDLATAAVIKTPGSKLTEIEIVDHVAKEMYEPKRLRGGVFFLDDIPKTGSGKYIRTKTRDKCLGIQSDYLISSPSIRHRL